MAGSIPASATSEAASRRAEVRVRARAVARPRRWRAPAALGLGIAGALVLVALLADRIAPGDPFASVAPPLVAPSLAHPMGTDDLGRDLFAAVVHGARTSLFVSLAVTAIAMAVGVAAGAVAGWRGAWLGDVLMRLAEIVQVVPRFFLAVVVVALFGPGIGRLVVLLGLTSWPLIARVVRAQVLSLRGCEFVEAARALGTPASRIVMREILPAALPAAIVVASVNAAGVILLEAALAFLGLGDPDRMSWGFLASNAQRFLRVAWWMALFPGAAIALAVAGLNLVGDAVNDALSPRIDA